MKSIVRATRNHEKTIKGGGKRKNRSNRKDARRAEALARQEEYGQRTPREQMALVLDRPGESARELTKLSRIIGKG